MVSVSDPLDNTLHSLLKHLERSVTRLNTPANLDGLLAAHFDSSHHLENLITWQTYLDPKMWVEQNSNILHQAPSLAVLGCLLAHQAELQQGNLDQHAVDTFKANIIRVQQRGSVFSFSNSWIWQLDIVLGITLGVTTIGDVQLLNWLLDLLKRGFNRPKIPLLPKIVYGYASSLIGESLFSQPISGLIRNVTNLQLPELALVIWLVKREILSVDQNRVHWLDETQSALVQGLIMGGPYEVEDYKAAIVWEVVTSYIESRSHYPSLDRVISLLQNFLPGMERWPGKWPITREEDVQNLLWLILRSAFNDLRYEEYLPKLGRSGQRYDLGIPSLGLIVEVKYIYPEQKSKHAAPRKQLQKIVDDIGKDVAQLQPQTRFTTIIVFVYDESCSVEHHEWTRQALESISLVKQAIIVSAPATLR